MERADVRALAKELMIENGLRDWTFAFDKAKTRAGLCDHATKSISVSEHYIVHPQTTPDHVKDTILHEIAHALTPGHKHDGVWTKKALDIGCSAARCCAHRFVQGGFLLTCACGNVKLTRHRIHPKFHRVVCKVCSGKLSTTRTQ